MGKKIKFLVLLMAVVLLTGCVKMDVTMEIKNDKSMNFSMIYAVSKELDEYNTSSDEEQIKEYENKGFYVEKYDKDGKSGYKITKQYKNIDDISTEGALEKVDMTEALSNDNQYMFTIKKGFLKNTYSASYNFNTSGYESNGFESEYYDTCEYRLTGFSCGPDVVQDQEANRAAYEEYVKYQQKQMSEFTEGMDLKFNLKLPNKVKSSNATSVTNGGKNLVWDLSKTSDVVFEFEVYNMTNVYIAIGVGIGIAFILFICIISMKKGGNKTNISSIDKNYKPSYLNDDIGLVDTGDATTPSSGNSEQIVNNNIENVNEFSANNTSSTQFIDESISNTNTNTPSTNSFIPNENVIASSVDSSNVVNNDNLISNPNSAFDMPPMIGQDNSNNNNSNVN